MSSCRTVVLLPVPGHRPQRSEFRAGRSSRPCCNLPPKPIIASPAPSPNLILAKKMTAASPTGMDSPTTLPIFSCENQFVEVRQRLRQRSLALARSPQRAWAPSRHRVPIPFRSGPILIQAGQKRPPWLNVLGCRASSKFQNKTIFGRILVGRLPGPHEPGERLPPRAAITLEVIGGTRRDNALHERPHFSLVGFADYL